MILETKNGVKLPSSSSRKDSLAELDGNRNLENKILANERISSEEALELFDMPLTTLAKLATHRRDFAKKNAQKFNHIDNNKASQANERHNKTETISYIIDRNINYTNICNVYCKFCAFYRTEKDTDSYVLSWEDIRKKLEELQEIGGVQVLLQGGHHPKLDIDFYLEMLANIKKHFPQINIHGFSPPEILHFSQVFGIQVAEVLAEFKRAGLGSIPGGGGEILVDRVRKKIAPLKCSADEWLGVMETAHKMGLTSSATMMFGHVETLAERIEHLSRIRNLQDKTGNFTAFICWTFQPENNVLKAKKTSPSDYLRTQAISRIYLDNVTNIQNSWVTQGPEIGQLALSYGANDFGSVMMEENVVSPAGASYRLHVDEIEELITTAGYEPRRRNTWYELI